MRKLWKMRMVFIPQIMTAAILFISVVLAPGTGMGDTAPPRTRVSTPDGTVITTTYESASKGDAVVIKTHSTILRHKEDAADGSNAFEPAAAATKMFDASVLYALSKMGLSKDHIELWSSEHPTSTLNKLNEMPVKRQQMVADIAMFIRSVNKNLSPKVSWREACALVYYSAKYGVPAELAVGMAKAESHFNPSVQSRSGACGVMQVMWKVHSGILRAKGIASKKDHMFDPERGIEAGVMLISRYIGAYGTVQKALNRYYGGISTAYLKKINKNMAMLEDHSGKTGYQAQ